MDCLFLSPCELYVHDHVHFYQMLYLTTTLKKKRVGGHHIDS